MNFGDIVLQFRAKHDLNQEEMAEVLDVGRYMVWKYENGKAKPSKKNKLLFRLKMQEYEKKKGEKEKC